MALSNHLIGLFGGIARALSHRTYRRFWYGNAASATGRWMYRMAVGWLTWELTESTSWLGIVAFADTFPLVVVTLVAGAIADRIGYFRVMRVSILGAGIVTAVFAAMTITGVITIEGVVILTVLFGVLEALAYPSRMSAVHTLVPKEDLSAGIALGSTTFNAARIIGPAIAGGLILWIGNGGVIAIGSLTFWFYFGILFVLPMEEKTADRKLSLAIFGDIWRATVYTLRDPGIAFLMMILAGVGVLIRPYIDLLPGFASQVFGRGADGLALLLSSIGVGAMCAGLWMAQRGETRGLMRIVTEGLFVCCGGVLLFTITGHIWIAAGCLAVSGFCMLATSVGSQTLIQNSVDSAMRARVMSLFVVISWGLPALGAVFAGWLASFIGLQWTIGGGATLGLIMWLWARFRGRSLAAALER